GCSCTLLNGRGTPGCDMLTWGTWTWGEARAASRPAGHTCLSTILSFRPSWRHDPAAVPRASAQFQAGRARLELVSRWCFAKSACRKVETGKSPETGKRQCPQARGATEGVR